MPSLFPEESFKQRKQSVSKDSAKLTKQESEWQRMKTGGRRLQLQFVLYIKDQN